jgi:hypothetical protein
MIPTVFHSIRFVQPDDQELGGICFVFTSAVAINYGDVVYFSAANTVTKSTTVANYVSFAGVAVGGDLTYNAILQTKPTTGTVQVASASGTVLVQVCGIADVITAATDAAGARVMADPTTAGRVIAGVVAGQMVGTLLQVGVVGNLKRMLIDHR